MKSGMCWIAESSKKTVDSREVLVFPAVSNYRRFLIHKLVETSFSELKTFSVGQGDLRRTVVCFQKDYQSPPETGSESTTSDDHQPRKRKRTMPSIGIYRPPAARRLEQHVNVNERVSLPKVSSVSRRIAKVEIGDTVNKCDEKKPRQRRPDMAVYVPRGLRLTSHPCVELTPVSENKPQPKVVSSTEDVEMPPVHHVDEEIVDFEEKSTEVETVDLLNELKETKDEPAKDIIITNEKVIDDNLPEPEEVPVDDCCKKSQENDDDDKRTDLEINLNDSHDDHIEENGNRSIDSPSSNEDGRPKLNPDECDWDLLFDDSGECLDPTLLNEVTSAVGQVTIEAPKTKYDDYVERNVDDEFPHVIEVYNFPAEFKTQDLVMVFNDFKHAGFEIKWVDDTHALGIFGNAHIVSEVLKMQHPLVKTRSLSEASPQCKTKARRCADSLTTYVARPDTCAALARRLVTGALGVRLPTQRAEREAERKILSEAREKKRLAARQREAAWEGTFT